MICYSWVIIVNSRRLAKEGLVVSRRNPYWEIKILYDSTEPSNISYGKALATLHDQNKWEELNLGQKLNVVKVFSRRIAEELDIPVPIIRLADYRGLIKKSHPRGTAFSIRDGVALNRSRMKYVVNIRNTIAHELRHIYQYYVVYSDYTPKVLPPQEIVEKWEKNITIRADGSIGHYKTYQNYPEWDAAHYATDYSVKTFGEDKEVIDNPTRKIPIIRKRSIRETMKHYKKKWKDASPSKRDAIVNGLDELKQKNPEFAKEYEKLKRSLLKQKR